MPADEPTKGHKEIGAGDIGGGQWLPHATPEKEKAGQLALTGL
ncbi:hypothetical protein [Burkholderia stagnalis]|nr:hypothetical protein [Burkholderia stagnalis]